MCTALLTFLDSRTLRFIESPTAFRSPAFVLAMFRRSGMRGTLCDRV